MFDRTPRRSIVQRWRSSMQLRLVSGALAIGVITVALLGTYLSTSIRDGMFDKRIGQLDNEYARTAAVTREAIAASPAATTDEVQALLVSMVRERIGAGQSIARGSLLAAIDEDTATGVNDVFSVPAMDLLVSPALRAATAASDDRYMWQSVLIPAAASESGHDEPGVVFGSLVDVPNYGRFGLFVLYSLQPEAETLLFVQRTLLGGGAAVLATVGIITFLMTRQAIVPVTRAAATASRLAEGYLTERMPVKGVDEMATLGRSFNDMAASLQDQIEQLEKLSATQRRFVSDVSHELRTPLTTIRMAGEVIYASRDELDPAARRSAELLQNQLDRFEALLTDLLEISRHDAGAAALDVEELDLTALVRHVVEGTEPLAERKRVPVTITAPSEPVRADFDARRVERILRNLVVNAIEHAEGKPVSIYVAGNETAVSVLVRDYGVGLDRAQLRLVFERFWRADPARARTTGGTGLGLAISLEDARLHGGRLDVDGEYGLGAAFRLTLPRRAGLPVSFPPLPLWENMQGAELVPVASPAPQGAGDLVAVGEVR